MGDGRSGLDDDLEMVGSRYGMRWIYCQAGRGGKKGRTKEGKIMTPVLWSDEFLLRGHKRAYIHAGFISNICTCGDRMK
jgi:hypothetical protein